MVRRRKTRTISVQRPDIIDGVQHDPKRCTIQLAASRAFPDANEVSIASGLMRIEFDDEEWVYEIPRSAVCIPIMIDEGMRADVEPLDFSVTRPHVIPKKKKADKPVAVRQHLRAKPGDGEVKPGPNVGIAKSAQQRSAAARMRDALRLHFNAKKGETRFQGIGV